MKYLKTFILIILFTTFFCIFVYKFFPQARTYITSEDSLIETLSALLFLFSFVMSCYAIISPKKIYYIKTLIIITILSLIGFLDELSFGERLFDIKMPILHGIKIDAIHDFYVLGYILVDKNILVFTIMLLISLLSILTLAIILFRRKRVRFQEIYFLLINDSPYALLILFGILIFFSLFIDLGIISWKKNYWMVLEEVSEMNAAVALVLANLLILNDQHSSK